MPPPLTERPVPIWVQDHAEGTPEAPKPDAEAAVIFQRGAVTVPEKITQILAPLVAFLKVSPNERLRLTAYASGTADQPVEARRLSLQRALAVRAVLMNEGIRSGRIDVHAMGTDFPNTAPEQVPDKVDMIVDSVARAKERDQE